MNKETSGLDSAGQLAILCSGSQAHWYLAPMTIAENVKRLREERKLSQKQLATLADLSQQLVSQIENGKNRTTKCVPALAKALGVSPDKIDPAYAPGSLDEGLSELIDLFDGLEDGQREALLVIARAMRPTTP